jgi:hypothetical protein
LQLRLPALLLLLLLLTVRLSVWLLGVLLHCLQ